MLDQHQRHQYLDALGITSWLPVQPLPAAAPSDEWVWDFRYPAPEIPFSSQPAAAPARQSRPDTPRVDPAKARAALNDTLALVTEAVKPAAAKTPEPSRVKLAPRPKRSAPVPRFRLALVALGDCMVVDALPTAQGGEFSQAHQTLLKNIGHFLLPAPAQASHATVINWPLLSGSTLVQDRSEALGAVHYKLKGLLQRHGSKRLLLLGEAAMQVVLDTDAALDGMRGPVQHPDHPELTVIASYSLSQLLRLPEMKAELWQDIQPLRGAGAVVDG